MGPTLLQTVGSFGIEMIGLLPDLMLAQELRPTRYK